MVDRRAARVTEWLCAAALLASAGWAVYEHATAPVLPYDDAFITYRYVANLTRGAGLTYNPPAHVWGFTSPLYVLWLTVLHVAARGVDLPTIAIRANVIFVLAAGAAALLLVRRYTTDVRVACLAACVLMVHPSLLSISTGGMESMLFLSLVLFTFLALAAARPAVAGALTGLAFLARPEAVILFPLAALRYWRTPRQLLSMALVAAGVAGAWLAFAAAYYHAVVPLPIIAKNRPLYPLPPGHALRVMFGYMGPALFGQLPAASFGRSLTAAAVIVASTAACVVSSPLRARHAWMPGAFLMLAIALYGYSNPMFFEWYWPPLLGTALVGLTVGWVGIWRAPPSSAPAAPSGAHRTLRALAYWAGPVWIAIVTIAAYNDNAGGHSKSVRFVDQDGMRLRILAYRRIGEELSALTSGAASLAAPEVGALGYYFAGRVIDACGLVSPEAIQFLPVPPDQRMGPTVGSISVDLVQSTNPDWVVSMPIFAEKSLLRSKWFSDRYELASAVPLPKICFDSRDVLVFKRRAIRP